MPLETGESKKSFSHNVATEMNAGKPQNQAVAIAYAEKRAHDAIDEANLQQRIKREDYAKRDAATRSDGEMCKSLADSAEALAKRFDAFTPNGLSEFVGQPVEVKDSEWTKEMGYSKGADAKWAAYEAGHAVAGAVKKLGEPKEKPAPATSIRNTFVK